MPYQPKSYRKFLAGAVTATVAASVVTPVATQAADLEFPDVPSDAYYADAVYALVEAGVINGYEDGTFRPTEEVTRAEIAKIIAVQLGLDYKNSGESSFSDVEGHWADREGYLAAVEEAGIMTGDGNGKFRPNDSLSRAELAAVLVRAFDLQPVDGFESSFTDLGDQDEWAVDAITTLEANGYTNGVSDGKFEPDANVKRGDTALFIYRVINNIIVAIPDIISVQSTSSTTIEVTFDGTLTKEQAEALQFTFNPALEVKKVELNAGAKAAAATTTVVLTTEEQDPSVTYNLVAVNGIELDDAVEVEILEPKVVSVEAIDTTKLVVTFNKSVDEDTATNVANYQLDGKALPASADLSLSADGKTVTITVSKDHALTNASYVTLTVSVGDSIRDSQGNAFAQTAKAVFVNDTKKPEVTSSSYVFADNKLTINFSEPLDTVGTVVVKDADGVIQNVSLTLDTSGLFATLDTSNLDDDKTYTLTMVGATDLSGNYFNNNTVSVSFKTGAAETVKPTIQSIKAIASDRIEVTFSERLSDAGTLNNNNLVLDTNLDDPYDYSVDSTGLVYTIVVPAMINDSVYSYTFAGQVDLNNNKIDPVTKQISYFDDVTPPELVSTSVNNRLVTLTFNEAVVDGGGTATLRTPENVVYTIADGDINTVVTNNKQITIDLSKVVGANAATGTYTLTLSNKLVQDAEGNSKAYTATFTLSNLPTNDTDKPQVNTVAYIPAPNGGTVVVEFDEDVDSTALNLNNYTVDGQKVFKDAYFDSGKQRVVLTLKENIFEFDADRVLEIANVSDLAGNKMNTYTETITFNDNTAPKLLSAKLEDDLQTISLTFNEDLEVATIVEPVGSEEFDFKVLIGGVPVAITNTDTEKTSVNDRTFNITLDNELTATEYSKVITIAPTDNFDVADANGNVLSAFTSFTVTK